MKNSSQFILDVYNIDIKSDLSIIDINSLHLSHRFLLPHYSHIKHLTTEFNKRQSKSPWMAYAYDYQQSKAEYIINNLPIQLIN